MSNDDEPRKARREAEASRTASFAVLKPESLKEYNQVHPGLSERIIAMAEAEANHRHTVETLVINAQISELSLQRTETNLGQWFAFALCATAIVGATIIGARGYQWASVGLGGGSLASLAAVFVLGRKIKPPQHEGRGSCQQSDE